MKSKINKIGMEIEGEFSEELKEKIDLLAIGNWTHDGSISRCMTETGRMLPRGHKKKLIDIEFVSIPFEIDEEGIEKIKKFFSLLKEYYKKGEFHYNRTMGLHIHVSFTSKLPVEIWSGAFVEYFRAGLIEKFPEMYRRRLSNSTYCKKIENEKEIAFGEDRYREINFKPAFEKHGTIEFRIFASDSPVRMQRYLFFTIRRIKGFLGKSRKLLRQNHNIDIDLKRKKEEIVETIVEKITQVVTDKIKTSRITEERKEYSLK